MVKNDPGLIKKYKNLIIVFCLFIHYGKLGGSRTRCYSDFSFEFYHFNDTKLLSIVIVKFLDI